MKPKPWQIAVIVIGLLAAGWLFISTLAGGDDLDIPDYYYLIDVETGTVFKADKRVPLDSPNPDTGKKSLVRVGKAEDGTWFVSERDLALLNYVDKDVQVKAIDPKTGELKITPESPKSYPRP